MNITEITQQTLRYSRESLERQLNEIVALQEKAEGVFNESLAHSSIVSAQGREALLSIVNFGREFREGLRQQLLKGHELFENLIPVEH